jgi:hypothetical protein
MYRSLRVPALVAALALSALGCNDATEDADIFRAALSPGEETPPVSSAASGTAGFQISGNRVHYSIEVRNIRNVVAAHIHAAPRGTPGPIRVPFPLTGTPIATVDGILLEGSFGAADVQGASFDDVVALMRSGGAYVNVHTSQYPAGEIRGQIEFVPQDND